MDDEAVCPDQLNHGLEVAVGQSFCNFRGAYVGEYLGCGRVASYHGEAVAVGAFFKRLAHAADAEWKLEPFGCFGKFAVEVGGFAVSSGHGGDHEREADSLSEKVGFRA